MNSAWFQLDPLEPRRFLTAAYQIQDLGSLGGGAVIARDINELGQIVGDAIGAHGEQRAFLWSPCDGIRDLMVPDFRGAYATAINDSGQVVGAATYDAGLVNQQAFVFSNGKIKFLPRPRESDNNLAVDINNRGEIITWEYSSGGSDLGSTYVYSPSTESFSYVASDRSNAINNSGVIAGIQGSDYVDVNPLFSARYVHGTDINDRGIIVSRHWQGNDSVISVRDAETTQEWIEYDSKISVAEPLVNNIGTIIGSAYTTVPYGLGFGWIRDGNLLRDLNSLIPKNSGWQILHANAINDKGQIVGDGLHNGQKRAFVLNPTGSSFPKEAGPTDIHLQEVPQQQSASAANTLTRHKSHHTRPAKHIKPKANSASRVTDDLPAREFLKRLLSGT